MPMHKTFAAAALLLGVLIAWMPARAETAAATGCPQFHCAPEATTVLQPSVAAPTGAVTHNRALGGLAAQGCSGDGATLACLVTDRLGAKLKRVDAANISGPITIEQPSALIAPLGSGISAGQVPVVFQSGRIAAGDAAHHVRFDSGLNPLDSVALTRTTASNFGMVLVSPSRGVVAQSDGWLTLIDTDNWLFVHDLQVKVDGQPVSLVSTHSGSDGVVYLVARSAGAPVKGYVIPVDVTPSALTQRLAGSNPSAGVYRFKGASGASVVVVKGPLVALPATERVLLLHQQAQTFNGLPMLVALRDDRVNAPGLFWASPIPLDADLQVTPTIDEVGDGSGPLLYYQLTNIAGRAKISAHRLQSGAAMATHDLITQPGSTLPAGFTLNSHLGASRTTDNGVSRFVLLSSGYVPASGSNPGAQLLLHFVPSTGALSARTLDPVPARGTLAWNLGQRTPGSGSAYCSILAVSSDRGSPDYVARVCAD